MANVTMTRGKFEGIQACADERGVIAAAAMDQRGSLRKAIAGARKVQDVGADALAEFKTAVTRILTRHSSAILMDPEFGLGAIKERAPGTGVLLAYEKTGYDASVAGRLPDLLPEWSVRRLVEAGADAIKILLYYAPYDKPEINELKHAFIERIGAECAAYDVPFFLEPLAYPADGGDEKGVAFARSKPELVRMYMEEFSKPHYGVDVLKVEVPVNVKFVQGMRAHAGGEYAYTREEAQEHFRAAAAAAKKPFIYLSAGVDNDVFLETLELAAEADTPFSGVLCGRATWKEAIPVYGERGLGALEEWLEDEGLRNIQALNAVLSTGAKPWFDFYGGRDQISIVDSPARPH